MHALTILQRCFTTVTFWPPAATTIAVNSTALNCSDACQKQRAKQESFRPLLLFLRQLTKPDEMSSTCFFRAQRPIPRSRIALEIRTHSHWISRLLSELGHEVIVANAQGAADWREPQERRSAGCADAGAAGADRSGVAVSGAASQRAGASGSHDDSSARRTGAGTHGTGQHGSRTGEVLWRTLAWLQRAQHESGESGRVESG